MPEAECTNCDTTQEVDKFFLEVGMAFGLKGISCEVCGELIPRENIDGVEEVEQA